jgi:transposase
MSESSGIVFVIDDDPSVREALGRMIRSIGLQVELFGSAREFLNRKPPEMPACITLDKEKRRIVEATLVPGASIARVAREHGVDMNQVFQWRHEYRKETLGIGQQAQTRLVPVTVTAEPSSVTGSEIGSVITRSGSIHIELPGRAVISVEAGVDPELVRTVLGSLLR